MASVPPGEQHCADHRRRQQQTGSAAWPQSLQANSTAPISAASSSKLVQQHGLSPSRRTALRRSAPPAAANWFSSMASVPPGEQHCADQRRRQQQTGSAAWPQSLQANSTAPITAAGSSKLVQQHGLSPSGRTALRRSLPPAAANWFSSMASVPPGEQHCADQRRRQQQTGSAAWPQSLRANSTAPITAAGSSKLVQQHGLSPSGRSRWRRSAPPAAAPRQPRTGRCTG